MRYVGARRRLHGARGGSGDSGGTRDGRRCYEYAGSAIAAVMAVVVRNPEYVVRPEGIDFNETQG